jgi:hypothetical protein
LIVTQVIAGCSFVLYLLAFIAVSEGVSCVGYCFGEERFKVHFH